MKNQKFAAFTPVASTDYYTSNHRPRYITPVGEDNKYVVYNLRSPIESPLIKHRGFALYENPTTRTMKPALVGYYIQDVGIVAPDRVQMVFN